MRNIISTIPEEPRKHQPVPAAYRLAIQQPLQRIVTKQVHHHRSQDYQ